MFLAEGWQSANSPRELLTLAVPAVRTTDAPHLKVKGESYKRWGTSKVQRNKKVIEKAQKEEKTVHFASLMDSCHLSQKLRIVKNDPKVVLYYVTAWWRTRRLVYCVLQTDIFRVAHDSRQRMGQYFTVSMMRRTSKRRNRLQWTWRTLHKYEQNRNHNVHHFDSCTLAALDVGTSLRNDFIIEKMDGRKYLGWEILSMYCEKTLFFSVYVDDIKMGDKLTTWNLCSVFFLFDNMICRKAHLCCIKRDVRRLNTNRTWRSLRKSKISVSLWYRRYDEQITWQRERCCKNHRNGPKIWKDTKKMWTRIVNGQSKRCNN